MNWPEFYEAYRLLDDQSTIVYLIKVKKTEKIENNIFCYKVRNRLTIPSVPHLNKPIFSPNANFIRIEGWELFEKSN